MGIKKRAYTADWHADNMNRTYTLRNSSVTNREKDMDKQIKTIADTCEQQGVCDLRILGDLFEKYYVQGYHFARVVDYVRLFTSRGIEVTILSGNHDESEAGDSVMIALGRLRDKCVRVVTEVEVQKSDGVTTLLIPHVRKDLFKQYSSFTEYICNLVDVNAIDVVEGHFQPTAAIAGSEESFFSGSTRYLDVSVFVNATHIFCGHVHRPQQLGNCYIPGTLVKYDLTDAKDTKRFLIYNIAKNSVESFPLHCQNLYEYTIDLINNTSIDLSDLSQYKKSMVSIEVLVQKENRSLVIKKQIVEAFEAAGVHVIAFKVTIVADNVGIRRKTNGGGRKRRPIDIFKEILKEEIVDTEIRKRLFSLGKELL